ncbi:MAG: type I methionyl aminopeptidase [Desulfobacterales bacterium]|nr:type I methionyl aminopeptidase [Desulfobacterales bacterium]
MNRKSKVGRNDPCPCGSGKKYKRCCQGKAPTPKMDLRKQYEQKHRIRFKTQDQIEGIRQSGKLTVATLDMVEKEIRPGITTNYINTLVHEFTISNNAIPAPLNYRGFPKSVCTSVNNEICHGIPDDRILKDGDIVNVDVTPILNGYYADANKTFYVGPPGKEAVKIVSVARECLKRGIGVARPGNTTGDIGWAIQSYAEENGCSVVREFVGHGVGLDFHEPPQILHYGKRGQGIKLLPGMVFTIEPMINLGQRFLHVLDNDWTAVTDDGELSAQFEQTVLITDSGVEIMTPYEL